MTKGRMNRGGPKWRRWCGMYEDSSPRRRLRAERRVRRDKIARLVARLIWDEKAGIMSPREDSK